MSGSSGFGNFTGLDAGRADFHPARATLGRLYAYRLQVWIEATWGAIVRVRDIVAELRTLAADFTTFGHTVFATSVIETKVYSKGVSGSSSRDSVTMDSD